MPSRPPGLKAKPKAQASRWNRTQSTTERGYGWKHQKMRERVLREEPLCRMCFDATPRRYTPSGIADHIIPKAEGGTDDRSNYQALGDPKDCDCHVRKTAEEAKRALQRARL
jgi:5-methylcytosine-specific restriction protein A